ncbi:TorF family putative porin [Dyella tabacisoli]|uniref:Cellulose biosynthesis protein BcsS n=1 Tax=Dyella tabacisoli TaxID=2282381 RepID=A0A369UMZ5_9GAMM|nr:TorF family putative porin [Dyella tabacisoli]RDD81445.1 hypothetical protein DVJ77_12105 [Dyella tabacisoli]
MLRAAVALLILLSIAEAHAQVSGSVTLVSDDRFRGVSLSDGRPAVQVAIAYDHADGWYAGAFASSVRLEQGGRSGAQGLVYMGFARRISPGLSWELGSQYTRFSGHEHYAYPEIYIGLASEHLSGRLYYTHDYFGSGTPMVYAELGSTRTLSDHLYLFGHVGMLRRNGHGPAHDDTSHYRFDIRAGIGTSLSGCDLQVSWITARGAAGNPYAFGYPLGTRSSRNTWMVSLSRSW